MQRCFCIRFLTLTALKGVTSWHHFHFQVQKIGNILLFLRCTTDWQLSLIFYLLVNLIAAQNNSNTMTELLMMFDQNIGSFKFSEVSCNLWISFKIFGNLRKFPKMFGNVRVVFGQLEESSLRLFFNTRREITNLCPTMYTPFYKFSGQSWVLFFLSTFGWKQSCEYS